MRGSQKGGGIPKYSRIFLECFSKGEDEIASSRGESTDNAKEEEGSAEGAKSMKELLEKIYGARTKAATQTSVGKDQISVGGCSNFIDSTYPGGYTEYRDADSRVILDVDEEREAMRRAIEVLNIDLGTGNQN